MNKHMPTLLDLKIPNWVVGLRVQIHPMSLYRDSDNPNNPINTVGLLVGMDLDRWLEVEWDNGYRNHYKLRDLMVAPEVLSTKEQREMFAMIYGVDLLILEEYYGN